MTPPPNWLEGVLETSLSHTGHMIPNHWPERGVQLVRIKQTRIFGERSSLPEFIAWENVRSFWNIFKSWLLKPLQLDILIQWVWAEDQCVTQMPS